MTTIAETSLTNSQILRGKIELLLPEVASAGAALKDHPHIEIVFPNYMFVVHCMIRASVPLMQTALERCREIGQQDPLCTGLIAYLSQHIREETDHDEWLLQDLEVLGVDRSELLQRIPPASVAAMVGAQYYWIHHHHPVALLGYIAVMEGYPPTEAQVDDLVARTGFPRRAFRTLLKHVHLDQNHRDDLNDLLDALPLTPRDHAVIGSSALTTMSFGAQAVREVLAFEGDSPAV